MVVLAAARPQRGDGSLPHRRVPGPLDPPPHPRRAEVSVDHRPAAAALLQPGLPFRAAAQSRQPGDADGRARPPRHAAPAGRLAVHAVGHRDGREGALGSSAEEFARTGTGRLEYEPATLEQSTASGTARTAATTSGRPGWARARRTASSTATAASTTWTTCSSRAPPFPTSSQANPALTIVALSLRLADHLERLAGRPLAQVQTQNRELSQRADAAIPSERGVWKSRHCIALAVIEAMSCRQRSASDGGIASGRRTGVARRRLTSSSPLRAGAMSLVSSFRRWGGAAEWAWRRGRGRSGRVVVPRFGIPGLRC